MLSEGLQICCMYTMNHASQGWVFPLLATFQTHHVWETGSAVRLLALAHQLSIVKGIRVCCMQMQNHDCPACDDSLSLHTHCTLEQVTEVMMCTLLHQQKHCPQAESCFEEMQDNDCRACVFFQLAWFQKQRESGMV